LDEILDKFKHVKREIPFRYIGVPLSSKKLNVIQR